MITHKLLRHDEIFKHDPTAQKTLTAAHKNIHSRYRTSKRNHHTTSTQPFQAQLHIFAQLRKTSSVTDLHALGKVHFINQ